MTTSLHEPDLASMTIRELLAELARLEHRLNGHRAAGADRTNPDMARLTHRMSAISAHLRERRRPERTVVTRDAPPDADEADRIEQSIPANADTTAEEDEYPHQQEIESQLTGHE